MVGALQVASVLRCATSALRCSTPGLVGPGHTVQVRTLGRAGTVSVPTAAPLAGHGEVLLATIYFDSGSARLTRASRDRLDAAIRKVRSSGFRVADVDGYTDADGGLAFNLALSHDRTRNVASYLRRNGGLANRQSWHGETDPVASNADEGGKSRNRRVEVLIRY